MKKIMNEYENQPAEKRNREKIKIMSKVIAY